MIRFKYGDRVKVIIIDPMRYGGDYPKLGWTGTIQRTFRSVGEYVIKWDKNVKTSGDLVMDYMLVVEKKVVKIYGIAKFCLEHYK